MNGIPYELWSANAMEETSMLRLLIHILIKIQFRSIHFDILIAASLWGLAKALAYRRMMFILAELLAIQEY